MTKVSIICSKSRVKPVSIAAKYTLFNLLSDILLHTLVLMDFILTKVRSVVANETGTVGDPCCHDESSKYKLIIFLLL